MSIAGHPLDFAVDDGQERKTGPDQNCFVPDSEEKEMHQM